MVFACVALFLVPAASYAQDQGTDTSVLYIRETLLISLDIIKQDVESGNIQDALLLAQMNTQTFPLHLDRLRDYDRSVTDELHLGLLDLYGQIDGGTTSESLDMISSLEDAASGYVSINPDYGMAIALMLTLVDEQYQLAQEEQSDSLYEFAHRMTLRSQELFPNTNYDERLYLEVESFLVDLARDTGNRVDFHTVGTLISAINRDLAGHESAVHDSTILYTTIRHLYTDMLEALDRGDYTEAEMLGIEAYLENFEYLEPDIEKADPELLYRLEWDMREVLRQMIKDGEPADDIRAFVNDPILVDLAAAEALVQDLNKGTIQAVEKELLEMGDASDDQKSIVRDEIDFIRATLQEMLIEYGEGRYQDAHTSARTAYLDSYEYVEIPLRAIDPDFTLEVEYQFADLRNLIKSQAPYEEVESVAIAIKRNLDESERVVTGTGTIAPTIAFTSSFAVIFREGIEAILILGAIVTYLEASRNQRFVRYVYYGIIAAIGATAVTWLVASYIIEISGANRELIEAIAALSATAVLFYVSFWVLNKIEHKKWMEFVKAKVWQATTTGSVMVFVMLSFFTVYREGFETVLFYQAMFGLAKYMELYVGLGFVAGIGSMLVMWFVLRKLGRRLPLRALFGLTMGVGAYLSIAFLGNGIRELQVLEILPHTSLIGTVPRLDINMATMTGIYPTLETIVGQFILLGIYLAASTYVLVMRPRRAARLASMRRSRGDAAGTGS